MRKQLKSKLAVEANEIDYQALDFAPDLLAIQQRPPEKLPRTILILVALLFGIMLAWSFFARLDVIAVADGRLVPLSFTKVVQPAEQGVVSEILVKDGQVVRSGDLLLRLDARISQADNQAIANDMALKRLTLRRIDAELADKPLLPNLNEQSETFQRTLAQFNARRQAYLDGMAQENELMNKAKAELNASKQILEKLAQTLPAYQQTAKAHRELAKSGYFADLAVKEKEREALEKEQDLKVQTANVETLQSAIIVSQRRIAALRSQYRSQLENERQETVQILNRSTQEFQKTIVKVGQMEIRAPHDGVVKDLAVTTKGAVVAAGILLMNIVPQDEPLQAEVLLKNEEVGFIAVGQRVSIKVAAYPFQKYGLLDGEVELISADAIDPKTATQGQLPSLAYRALVRLKSTKFESIAKNQSLKLNAGMLVSAEIHQGQRTVLEYLLSPIQKVTSESGRER